MARLKDGSGRARHPTSERPTVPPKKGAKKDTPPRFGPVVTNKPTPPTTKERTCCNLVLPRSGVCSVCSS